MAEVTFANRDEPIPVLRGLENLTGDADGSDHTADPVADDGSASTQDTSGADPPEDAAKPSLLRQKADKIGLSLQDRVLTRLMQQIIPLNDLTDDPDEIAGQAEARDRRRALSERYFARPGFSLPLMASNFRRFNARIGVVFVFQTKILRLWTWHRPAQTLSLLLLYTFCCLYPRLLAALPPALLLLGVLVPAFEARHPAAPSSPSDSTSVDAFSVPPDADLTLFGPPTAPPTVVKPAPELSRDFRHNLRDLQNSMADFATAHDATLSILMPWTSFADPQRATALALLCIVATAVLLLIAPIIPWRALIASTAWILVGIGHPAVQEYLMQISQDPGNEPALANENTPQTGRQPHNPMSTFSSWARRFHQRIDEWIAADAIQDPPPAILEVEVFELQRRRRQSSSSPSKTPTWRSSAPHEAAASEWEPWLFTPEPWAPRSPARIAGQNEPSSGSASLEQVRPPTGWNWARGRRAGAAWMLDLASQSWVEDRLLAGLEVEVEGERWVYDLPDQVHLRPEDRMDYGREARSLSGSGSSGSESATNNSGFRGLDSQGQQDHTANDAIELPGEWRRRRWVREVQRVIVTSAPTASSASTATS